MQQIPDWYDPGISRVYSMGIMNDTLEPLDCVFSSEYEDAYIQGLLPNGRIIYEPFDPSVEVIRDYIRLHPTCRVVLNLVEQAHIYFVGLEIVHGKIHTIHLFDTDEHSILSQASEENVVFLMNALLRLPPSPTTVFQDHSMPLQECEQEERFHGGFCRAWALLFAETFCRDGGEGLDDLWEELIEMEPEERADMIFQYWEDKVEANILSNLTLLQL